MIFSDLWLFYIGLFGEQYTAASMALVGSISSLVGVLMAAAGSEPRYLLLVFSAPLLILFAPILVPIFSLVSLIWFLYFLKRD